MIEPTDQPPAGPRAMPAGATRREARLRRESLASTEFEVPQLAPSLAPPRVQPLPQPLVPTTGAAPTPSPRREARLRQAGSVPAAEPVDPGPTTGSAPRRRRAIVWLGIAAALVLIAGLGFGLWLVRAPESTAADSPHVAAPVDPIAERGFEGAGSPSAPAPPRTPSPTPTPPTAVPPVETVVTPTPVDSGQHDQTADGGSAPTSSAPQPAPAPGSPTPGNPAPAPAPVAPAPLAFTGLTENTTLGLLGIRILASDTLSLAGQPGATATVSYDSARAGSVTFDGAGRATVTVNGSLVDLGDPVITVAYSDGTAGSVLRARRSAI